MIRVLLSREDERAFWRVVYRDDEAAHGDGEGIYLDVDVKDDLQASKSERVESYRKAANMVLKGQK
jgi:hypothetical protein